MLKTFLLSCFFSCFCFCAQAKGFVFVIPAHNHATYCQKLFSSLESQTCLDFRVIYINDGSTDNTATEVSTYIEATKGIFSTTLITHKKEKGLVERAYETIHTCDPEEIVILLEGSSCLASKHVVEKLQNLYKNEDVWVAYGLQKNDLTNKTQKLQKFINNNFFSKTFRSIYWKPLHLKSFYAKLFQKVKLEEFFFRSKFIDNDFDHAYLFPIMEMAGTHIGYINDVLCTFHTQKKEKNRSCQRSPFTCRKRIYRSSSYLPLKSLTNNENTKHKSDLVIFSYDRPLQLFALLESIEKHVSGINKLSIIYRAGNERYAKAYEDVEKRFSFAHFIKQSKKPHKDFKKLTLNTLFNKSTSDYIIFSVDDIIIKDKIDITECVSLLEKTKSYLFSLRLGKNITYCYMGNFFNNLPHYVKVEKEVIGWKLNQARGDWMFPNSVDMTLYRKKDIEEAFRKTKYKNPNKLEIVWNNYKPSSEYPTQKRIGLAYTQSKVLNIPMNLVNIVKNKNKNMNSFSTKDLLEKYENGEKIDIDEFFHMQNHGVHMDLLPSFILR